MSKQLTALVTGSNRGIGFQIVKQLLENPISSQWKIVMCARDAQRGKEALSQLGSPSNLYLATVEVTNKDSVNQLAQQLKNELNIPKINVLINNAGWFSQELTHDSARDTFDINYYGVKNVTETLLKHEMIETQDENSQIIMVSSQLSVFANGNEPKIQVFKDYEQLSHESIENLLNEYLEDCKLGEKTVGEKGWPVSSYRMSKMALNAYSRLLADRLKKDGIRVNLCCPGWCSTDLGGPHAPRKPEQGAGVAVWLATSQEPEIKSSTGQFYYENQKIDF